MCFIKYEADKMGGEFRFDEQLLKFSSVFHQLFWADYHSTIFKVCYCLRTGGKFPLLC